MSTILLLIHAQPPINSRTTTYIIIMASVNRWPAYSTCDALRLQSQQGKAKRKPTETKEEKKKRRKKKKKKKKK